MTGIPAHVEKPAPQKMTSFGRLLIVAVFYQSSDFYRTNSSKKRTPHREPQPGDSNAFSLPIEAYPRPLRARKSLPF
jgi:hypothetical protein